MIRDKIEKEKITFRPRKDGKIEAIRDGKVVGYVMTNDYVIEDKEKEEDRTGTGNTMGRNAYQSG